MTVRMSERRMSGTMDAAMLELKSFLEAREGSSLGALIRHFDQDNDGKISSIEFIEGMTNMGYDPNGASRLFNVLDSDGSGEISMDAINQAEYILLRKFRIWCARRFESVDDLLHTFFNDEVAALSAEGFVKFLSDQGWPGGSEALLRASFFAAPKEGADEAEMEEFRQSFKWLEVEHKREQRRLQARARATQHRSRRLGEVITSRAELHDFKAALKAKFGNFIRAWRVALSPDDTLVLQRSEFLKACNRLNLNVNAKVVWKAFDRDESGLASIDELDPKSAEILALFQAWCKQKFGSMQDAFSALDADGSKILKAAEFYEQMPKLGWKHPVKELFAGLDKKNEKKITADSLVFLEKWRPLPFLTATPNKQALAEFKQLLLGRCRTFTAAWRRYMDKDNFNRCFWGDFLTACRRVGFSGDAAGCWRLLDSDCMGFITLKELDDTSNTIIMDFKKWCDDLFGSCRSAFMLFDMDGSKYVDYKEFRHCCRLHGFEKDVTELFVALDHKGEGKLSVESVSLLDEWPPDEETMFQEMRDRLAQRRNSQFRHRFPSQNEEGGPSSSGSPPILARTSSRVGNLSRMQSKDKLVARGLERSNTRTRCGSEAAVAQPESFKLLAKPRPKCMWRAKAAATTAVLRPFGWVSLEDQAPDSSIEVDFETLSYQIRNGGVGVGIGGDAGGSQSVDFRQRRLNELAWWEAHDRKPLMEEGAAAVAAAKSDPFWEMGQPSTELEGWSGKSQGSTHRAPEKDPEKLLEITYGRSPFPERKFVILGEPRSPAKTELPPVGQARQPQSARAYRGSPFARKHRSPPISGKLQWSRAWGVEEDALASRHAGMLVAQAAQEASYRGQQASMAVGDAGHGDDEGLEVAC